MRIARLDADVMVERIHGFGPAAALFGQSPRFAQQEREVGRHGEAGAILFLGLRGVAGLRRRHALEQMPGSDEALCIRLVLVQRVHLEDVGFRGSIVAGVEINRGQREQRLRVVRPHGQGLGHGRLRLAALPGFK